MKLKNLTIAIAMASLGMTSFAAQAEDGTSFYGSVRIGIENLENADTTKFRNWNSRMGFKAETEVADGLKGFGHYEFGVGTDASDATDPVVSTRKAYVGLKGGFGRVRLGQDYHTFYNTVIAPADVAWVGSTYATGSKGNKTNPGRTGEALTYDTTMGAVGVGATVYAGDDKLGDGYEVGATFNAGPVKLGIGAQDTDGNSGTAYGVSAGGEMGPAKYGIAFTDHDKTGSAVDVHLGFGGAYVAFGQADLDAGTKPTGVTLGYTHNIGKKTLAWFEAQKTDNDAGAEETALRAALKYDF